MTHKTSILTLAAGLLLASSAQAQTGTASYEVRFDASWSNTTHPGAFPFTAHFSPLVGGTHNDTVSLWQPGGIATNGIEVMAESGSPSPLTNEVNALITAGNAGQVISGPGAGSPDSVSTTFEVTPDFPLVSLVTMIAPSPDWFVGVYDLDMSENGQWAKTMTVELLAWDAGTDSGPNFNSGNQNTNPQDAIELVLNGPFFGATPLGTFTFTRLDSTSTHCTGKLNSQGCAPEVSFFGDNSVSGSVPFNVTGSMVLNNKPGLFFYGVQGQASLPFLGGTLCVAPPLRRTGVQFSGGTPSGDNCSGAFSFDMTAHFLSGVDTNLDLGDVVNGQFWSRDPQIGDGTGASLSNAIEFQLCP